jgi:hypothetical protein
MNISDTEHVKNQGRKCPKKECGSDEIEGSAVETGVLDGGDSFAYQKMVCLECEWTWQDKYKLVGYL